MNRKHLDLLCATLDHYTPRSAGGSGAIDNLVAACKECNEARGRGEHRSEYRGPSLLAADGGSTAVNLSAPGLARDIPQAARAGCDD